VLFLAVVLAGLARAEEGRQGVLIADGEHNRFGASSGRLVIQSGDHVCLIGNTLAERMQYFNHFETLLHSRFPQYNLVVRNLGWSADELTLRPRSLDFKDHGHTLSDHKADVIIAFFGFNESFAGPAGLSKFEEDLTNFIVETLNAKYNGKSAPRLALVSPIAHEDLGRRTLPSGAENNKNIQLYTAVMAKVAEKHGVPFVDLFTPAKAMMDGVSHKLTINGIHLSDEGDRQLAPVLDEALFGPHPDQAGASADREKLRSEIAEKNLQFFYDHRAVNGYYIYGGRKEPFGVVNFPHEFRKLRKMIANRDQRVWKVAQGESVPEEIDDSNTGSLPVTPTNFQGNTAIMPPEEAIKKFTLPPGYEVHLFASEVEFPALANPAQLAFDARGRLWVSVMPTYPMYLPGTPVDDKLLILEDVDGDGKADRCTVFADRLHVPTGFELGDGGVYLAQQPNLMFLADRDGDDHADVRQLILHGFDSADSHHAISAFTWDPGGALYMLEGTFHHTSVETPYGPVRNAHGGIYRYEPKTEKFETFVHYNFANPWGHVFDRWGQNFVADASGGANYYGTAFSGKAPQFTGQEDFGPFFYRYRRELKQFITKRVRPTSGCEIVTSRHFPDEAQGWFLLNNCIGEQAVLRHELREDGSGYVGTEIMPPLFKSTDGNFRPVHLQLGLDGALYVIDWHNPLVGHMQHSIRDPNRDHTHGRIWRVTYKERPLVPIPKIAGASIPELLELLKAYEDRTRYHVRLELRLHDTDAVVGALASWIDQLDTSDPDYEHHLLEALWVHQHHDAVNETLLRRVLRSPDYRARAAATRVLGYWRDRVGDPIGLLNEQAADDHPRVALEAVRAASFFTQKEAADAALSALAKHGNDQYIQYTLRETMTTLRPFLRGKS
jgi:glucose/arabinose dehydrogenase